MRTVVSANRVVQLFAVLLLQSLTACATSSDLEKLSQGLTQQVKAVDSTVQSRMLELGDQVRDLQAQEQERERKFSRALSAAQAENKEAFDGLACFHEKKIRGLSDKARWLWGNTIPGGNLSVFYGKQTRKQGYFTHFRLHPKRPSKTLQSTSWGTAYHWSEPRFLTLDEFIILSSFPSDYAFESAGVGGYMMGMSVPPKMMEGVASAVRDQWIPYLD